MNALKIANRAAEMAFDMYLEKNNACATMYVPSEVVAAAERAYHEAGGIKRIVVCGRGNRSHPVCSVYVRIDTRKHVDA